MALTVPEEDAFLQEMGEEDLADLFIVSKVSLTVGGELAVSVSEAEGEKCERCWKHSGGVGSNSEHPTLCPRCAAVVSKM